ncbi:MAG: hypothetical protein ACFB50_09670 [Rubrobacteraceae bacterium]
MKGTLALGYGFLLAGLYYTEAQIFRVKLGGRLQEVEALASLVVNFGSP